jgi:NodT family efflux transporter outer membrane factor (OMF) lipoprotein
MLATPPCTTKGRTILLGSALCLIVSGAGAQMPRTRLPVVPQVSSPQWRGQQAGVGGEIVGTQDLAATLRSNALQALIQRALAANADIEAARARVAQARAQLRVARAAMLPTVSASGGLNQTRTDNRGGRLFDFSDAFGSLDVAWDLDLFGGARAGRRAAVSRAEAAELDRRATSLAIEAEVARAFVQRAVLGERLKLLDRNLANARELERIVQVRLREGAGTRVETGLQAIEVRQLQAERHRLLQAMRQTENALAVLVAAEAPLFRMPVADLRDLSVPNLAPIQPAQLLVRRPDIRATEARIRAASGDVAQARAAFLPNLRLSASTLGQAAALGGPYGITAAVGASLLGQIFDGGRRRGELGVATAAQAETVQLYRAALLRALSESQDALDASEQSRARFALLGRVVEEARTTARLTRLQYLEGEADLRAVIDAQQLFVQAEDSRALAIQERLNATIDLYRAMGGKRG